MGHFYTGTIVDHTNEKSAFRVPMGAITAVSIAGALTDMGNLSTAIDALILGERAKEGWIGDDTVLTNLPATDARAHVELGWLITYRGNTSQKLYQFTLATADDNPDLRLANSDVADLAADEWVAFKTAFETLARTPDSDQETVTLVRARLVGRNR